MNRYVNSLFGVVLVLYYVAVGAECRETTKDDSSTQHLTFLQQVKAITITIRTIRTVPFREQVVRTGRSHTLRLMIFQHFALGMV